MYMYCNMVTMGHIYHYRTLHGRDQRKKAYFKFYKVHYQPVNSASLTTNSALLHCKECFIEGIKHCLWCNKALFVVQ